MRQVWQEFDEPGQHCQLWRDLMVRTVSAMILLVSVLLLTVPAMVATVVAVRSDGYGSRPDRCDRYADQRRML
jgi:hypothetical protein